MRRFVPHVVQYNILASTIVVFCDKICAKLSTSRFRFMFRCGIKPKTSFDRLQSYGGIRYFGILQEGCGPDDMRTSSPPFIVTPTMTCRGVGSCLPTLHVYLPAYSSSWLIAGSNNEIVSRLLSGLPGNVAGG